MVNSAQVMAFYPRDAMRRAGLCDSDVSVYRPSVTVGIKTERVNVMISSPSDSPMISLSGKV